MSTCQGVVAGDCHIVPASSRRASLIGSGMHSEAHVYKPCRRLWLAVYDYWFKRYLRFTSSSPGITWSHLPLQLQQVMTMKYSLTILPPYQQLISCSSKVNSTGSGWWGRNEGTGEERERKCLCSLYGEKISRGLELRNTEVKWKLTLVPG